MAGQPERNFAWYVDFCSLVVLHTLTVFVLQTSTCTTSRYRTFVAVGSRHTHLNIRRPQPTAASKCRRDSGLMSVIRRGHRWEGGRRPWIFKKSQLISRKRKVKI